MPSWQGSVAVQTKHQRTGLCSVTTGTNETSRDAARRAVRSLEQDLGVNPTLICVAHTEGVSLWRAEFGGDHMPHSLNHACQWMSPQDIPQRKHWYRPHSDVLTHFGVWSSGRNSTIKLVLILTQEISSTFVPRCFPVLYPISCSGT